MLGRRLQGINTGESIILPAGLILPLNSTTIPSGWSRFTLADDKFIVGAGNSYSAGATGGSTSVSISTTSSSVGNHTGVPNLFLSEPSGNPGYLSAAGGHSHSITGSGTAQDVYRTWVLIKANSDTNIIPGNARVLGAQTLSGLTARHTGADRFMMSSATNGSTGGSATSNISCTSNTTGSHRHGSLLSSNSDGGIAVNLYKYKAAGNHSHTITMSATLNTQRFYASLWSAAVDGTPFSLVQNAIGMWESATPPTGWALCDGTSGTPDMRDYFIRIGSEAQMGQVSGDNSVTFSGTTNTTGNHGHSVLVSSSFGSNENNMYHRVATGSHNHTASQNKTILPPYYALSFIMKL